MSIYIITAIPFFIVSLVLLVLAAKRRNGVFLSLGLSFMLTAVVNGLVGLSIGG